MSKPVAPTVPVVDDLTKFLPKYYTWREVLDLYRGDEDAFMDAWCDGTLPQVVRRACEDTLPPGVVQNWLLRRVVRQQQAIICLLQEPPA